MEQYRKIYKVGRMLIRGMMFKLLKSIDGGKSLRVAKGVHVHKKSDTKIYLGNKVTLYQKVGLYLDSTGAEISIGDQTYINSRTDIKC